MNIPATLLLEVDDSAALEDIMSTNERSSAAIVNQLFVVWRCSVRRRRRRRRRRL